MSHQRATQGKGGGLHFRTSPSWSSSAAFVFSMWVYTRASSARGHLAKSSWAQPRRGAWPDFVFVFVFAQCPVLKSAHPKSSKVFISDPVLHAKDKTRHSVYMTASLLPSPMVSKLSMPCFVFICFDINQFTCELFAK